VPFGSRTPRQPRPAPRPEDRLDFLAIVKALAIAFVGLLLLNFGANAVFQSSLPENVKQLNRDRDAAVKAYNDQATIANDKTKASAPEAPDQQRKADDLKAAVDNLTKEINDQIPAGLIVTYYTTVLGLLLVGSLTAGYMAARFTRGRRPGAHGAIAATGLILSGVALPGAFLFLEVAGLAGAGFLGGWLYVRRKGPWDGVLPERKPGLFSPRPRQQADDGVVDVEEASGDEAPPRPRGLAGLFQPRPRPARPAGTPAFGWRRRPARDDEAAVADEDEAEVDEAGVDDDLEAAEADADVVEIPPGGADPDPRHFGPAGRRRRKARRPRPAASGGDDIE